MLLHTDDSRSDPHHKTQGLPSKACNIKSVVPLVHTYVCRYKRALGISSPFVTILVVVFGQGLCFFPGFP
jgi:hypothetical protein